MPKGFASIKEAAKKIEEQSFDFPNVLFVRLEDDGDSTIVRFLEEGEEVYHFYFHDFSNQDGQNGWKTKVPCLDQEGEGLDCPGCEFGLKRGFQGLINVIWRDAPVFERDEDGKVVKKNDKIVVTGYEDQNAVWRGGVTIFSKTLARLDVKYGLTSMDFEITREGTGKKTTYSILPSDEKTPLSDADKELAKTTFNLEEVARFVDEDTFRKIIAENTSGENGSSDDEDEIEQFLANNKPFEE